MIVGVSMIIGVFIRKNPYDFQIVIGGLILITLNVSIILKIIIRIMKSKTKNLL